MFMHNEKSFLSHRLTLDESNSCPSRTTVLYVQLRTWCVIYRSAPSFTADFERKTSPSKLSLKKNKVEKISESLWADIWRSVNSVQQMRKWRAYCDPCTTTVFISDDRQSARVTTTARNFSHNSQVLRRKHPVLGIKLNPLSLLFQLARYHRNNTNKRL